MPWGRLLRGWGWAIVLVLCQGASVVPPFDHFTTGFALQNGHAQVACQTCHIAEDLGNVPKKCSGCHDGVAFSGKHVRLLLAY
jgi:hypothetical protein